LLDPQDLAKGPQGITGTQISGHKAIGLQAQLKKLQQQLDLQYAKESAKRDRIS
jgi:hypothetical protein